MRDLLLRAAFGPCPVDRSGHVRCRGYSQHEAKDCTTCANPRAADPECNECGGYGEVSDMQRTNRHDHLPWWWVPYMRLAKIMGWFGIPIITGWIVRKAAGRCPEETTS